MVFQFLIPVALCCQNHAIKKALSHWKYRSQVPATGNFYSWAGRDGRFSRPYHHHLHHHQHQQHRHKKRTTPPPKKKEKQAKTHHNNNNNNSNSNNNNNNNANKHHHSPSLVGRKKAVCRCWTRWQHGTLQSPHHASCIAASHVIALCHVPTHHKFEPPCRQIPVLSLIGSYLFWNFRTRLVREVLVYLPTFALKTNQM